MNCQPLRTSTNGFATNMNEKKKQTKQTHNENKNCNPNRRWRIASLLRCIGYFSFLVLLRILKQFFFVIHTKNRKQTNNQKKEKKNRKSFPKTRRKAENLENGMNKRTKKTT